MTNDLKKHQVKVTIEHRNGLTALLVCVDHECGYPEVWGWDSAAALESYHGEIVEFPPLDVEITGCEESGIDWQMVTDHPEGTQSDVRASAPLALAYIDKSIDNVADLDVVWENAEVVEVLEDVRSLLVTGEINPGSFEKAQAPTDEERHWSDAAASAYPGDEYDNADLRTAFGRGVKWERRRPAQTEPTDAQVEQALAALTRFKGFRTVNPHGAMRAALKAAFTAGHGDS